MLGRKPPFLGPKIFKRRGLCCLKSPVSFEILRILFHNYHILYYLYILSISSQRGSPLLLRFLLPDLGGLPILTAKISCQPQIRSPLPQRKMLAPHVCASPSHKIRQFSAFFGIIRQNPPPGPSSTRPGHHPFAQHSHARPGIHPLAPAIVRTPGVPGSARPGGHTKSPPAQCRRASVCLLSQQYVSYSLFQRSQAQDFSCFCRSCNFSAQHLCQFYNLGNHLAVGFSQYAFFHVQVVFETNSYVAAHGDGSSCNVPCVLAQAGSSPGGTGRDGTNHEYQVTNGSTHLYAQYEVPVQRVNQQALSVSNLQSGVDHALVEYFQFRLDASFLQDLSKVYDGVVGVGEYFIPAEVAGTAVQGSHFRGRNYFGRL